jgi:hypothetical protein
MLGGYYYEGPQTKRTFLWVGLTTIEELLEMIGLSLFVYTLLLQILRRHRGLAVTLTGDSGKPV